VVGSIRAMFKQDSKERLPVDIKELIQEVIALVHSETERHRITVGTHLDDELPKLLGHRVQLQQVRVGVLLGVCVWLIPPIISRPYRRARNRSSTVPPEAWRIAVNIAKLPEAVAQDQR
jgi:hypothetical protein